MIRADSDVYIEGTIDRSSGPENALLRPSDRAGEA